ncbi:hypothetical protein GCK72_022828 [Caenorhabditis remanei]|uniref:RING-type domain-containing protein n=1 Tax=Caenorhabditis remanei TaxID=31234 RepID=A0A6A5FV06_CAERE|nr:hypothetical protein GCK72_022828 [Caenorhabditis remanei]KAF1746374.1 hypothetical protein GCK72_022828 [Caenorhabditis remanei]
MVFFQVVHVLCDCVPSQKAQAAHNKTMALERRVEFLLQEWNGLEMERDRLQGEMGRRNAEIGWFRADRDAREETRCCVLCIWMYDMQAVLPKTFSCGHTFCQECIDRISVRLQWGSWLRCSTCRRRINIPAGGFPTTFAMVPAYIAPQPDHLQL